MINSIYDNIKSYTKSVDNSKYFAGIMMIVLNIGSKYITIRLSKSQETYFQSAVARQILLFSIIWIGTRDLIISLIISAVFIILTDHLFNEQSKLCILPESLKIFEDILDENDDGNITQIELENAKRILEKAKRREQIKKDRSKLDSFKNML